MTEQQARLLSLINHYYQHLFECTTTSGRKYNYERLKEIYNEDPDFCSRYLKFCDYEEYYKNRVILIDDTEQAIEEFENDRFKTLDELIEYEKSFFTTNENVTKETALKYHLFIYCMKKFQKATLPRWVNYWFDACVKIAKRIKIYTKFFIIDTKNYLIYETKNLIKKIKPKHDGESHTYLIKMFDEFGNWVYTKIGKTNNIKNRMNQLKKEYYKNEKCQIKDVKIIKEYVLPNDDLAQVLESLMRNYFRKTKDFIPNDRFKPFEPTKEDLKIFEKNYNLVLTNA